MQSVTDLYIHALCLRNSVVSFVRCIFKSCIWVLAVGNNEMFSWAMLALSCSVVF